MTIYQKLKFRKLIFHSFQHIGICHVYERYRDTIYHTSEGGGGLHIVNWEKPNSILIMINKIDFFNFDE